MTAIITFPCRKFCFSHECLNTRKVLAEKLRFKHVRGPIPVCWLSHDQYKECQIDKRYYQGAKMKELAK